MFGVFRGLNPQVEPVGLPRAKVGHRRANHWPSTGKDWPSVCRWPSMGKDWPSACHWPSTGQGWPKARQPSAFYGPRLAIGTPTVGLPQAKTGLQRTNHWPSTGQGQPSVCQPSAFHEPRPAIGVPTIGLPRAKASHRRANHRLSTGQGWPRHTNRWPTMETGRTQGQLFNSLRGKEHRQSPVL